MNLNVGKTKELTIGFRKTREEVNPVVIKGQTGGDYKYFGVHIDDKLKTGKGKNWKRKNWKRNSNAKHKKAQSRLLSLRKLRSFDVSRKLIHV